jgi:23S rRNA (cytosine1962-C5)-methyltransferase
VADRAIFPVFDPAWVVFDDGAIVVVDKPAGIPVQAHDDTRRDDLVYRLERGLPGRRFAVHQRLDRDTSGLVLFVTGGPEANRTIARQFEGRTITKGYLAVVERWEHADRMTIDTPMVEDDGAHGGRMRVATGRDRKPQRAVSHVRLVRRSDLGDRALVHVTLETGRTHQARVHLASVGAPIVGDRLYGTSASLRLMLHAAGLAFEDVAGAVIRLESKAPPEFEAALEERDGSEVYDDKVLLQRAIERALHARAFLAWTEGERRTSAFRVVNEAGDGLPKLAVDAYEAFAVAQFYEDDSTWTEERRGRVVAALDRAGFRGVYTKRRPKQASVIVDAGAAGLAPSAPSAGEAHPEDFVVLEEGMRVPVRLGDGLSTGIFLDQRANRRRVRETTAGTSVLNLFAYTCGFSLAASVGGAWRTVSVDASAGALERGEELFTANERLGAADDQFVVGDVFALFPELRRRFGLFDLVILDPPSFATTKTSRFSAASDYGKLVAQVLPLVRPGGRLLASTNHRGITPDRFRALVRKGADLAERPVAQLKDLPDPIDFPPEPGAFCHLKAVMLTLARDDARDGLPQEPTKRADTKPSGSGRGDAKPSVAKRADTKPSGSGRGNARSSEVERPDPTRGNVTQSAPRPPGPKGSAATRPEPKRARRKP